MSFLSKKNRANTVDYVVRCLGADNADLTIVSGGQNIKSVARVSEGLYKITWNIAPVKSLGFMAGFQATTPADLKGYSVVFEEYVESTKSVQFTVYNSSGTAADLIAAQWITLYASYGEAV